MDIIYLLFLQNLRAFLGDFFTEIMRVITEWGEAATLLPIIACVYWLGYKKLASRVMYGFTMGSVINSWIKLTACVSRPWLRDPRVIPDEAAKKGATGYSFPSGHTAKGFQFFGTIADENRRKSVIIPCCIMAMLIGFSRNFLGVHTPQDVIVSAMISIALIFLTGWLFTTIERGGARDLIFVGVSVFIGAALLVYASVKPYPATFADGSPTDITAMAADSFKQAGTLLGFLIGWIIERRFIKFELPANKPRAVFRLVYGLIFMIVADMLAAEAFAGAHVWAKGFALNFISFFVVTAVYPAAFKLTEKFIKAKSGDKAYDA
jgi:membrane-associated phospholipid phosphatase